MLAHVCVGRHRLTLRTMLGRYKQFSRRSRTDELEARLRIEKKHTVLRPSLQYSPLETSLSASATSSRHAHAKTRSYPRDHMDAIRRSASCENANTHYARDPRDAEEATCRNNDQLLVCNDHLGRA